MIGAAVGVVLVLVWLTVAAIRRGRIVAAATGGGPAHEALADFAEQSLELESVDQILALAARTSMQVFGAQHAVAFVHGVQEGNWETRSITGDVEEVPPAMRGVFGWFRHNMTIAVRADLGEARFGAMRGPLGQIMDRYDVDVVVPLVHRTQILAAIGFQLGRRPSGMDRSLMKKFRLEATSATANVRLHREASHIISLAREVDLASAAQQALVPDELDGGAGTIRWAGHFQAAGEAGSDFWCTYDLGGRVLVIIGDATGIGLAGSMVSAVVRSCCDAIIDAHGDRVDPASLLGTLNRALWRPEKPAHMTAFAALFDPSQGTVKYANAGHCFPYYVASKGKLGVLHGSGPVLGDELQSRYQIAEQAIASGDTLVFFTDGIVATQNPQGKPFGERRLQKMLNGTVDVQPGSLRDRIVNEVNRYRESRPRIDDEALIVVRV
jgi:serine phosphatase RsbU (regulator of sigma subunit)